MLNNFFIKYPIFTFEEFKNFHVDEENQKSRTVEAVLAYYCVSKAHIQSAHAAMESN